MLTIVPVATFELFNLDRQFSVDGVEAVLINTKPNYLFTIQLLSLHFSRLLNQLIYFLSETHVLVFR